MVQQSLKSSVKTKKSWTAPVMTVIQVQAAKGGPHAGGDTPAKS